MSTWRRVWHGRLTMDTIAMINHDQPRFEGELKGFKRGKLSKDIKGEAAKGIGRRKKKKVLSFSFPTKHIFIYIHTRRKIAAVACYRCSLLSLMTFLSFSLLLEKVLKLLLSLPERERDRLVKKATLVLREGRRIEKMMATIIKKILKPPPLLLR